MMSHIIGEAIFDITFGPDREGDDLDSNLARMVQARLLPVIDEVFDEMAVDREAVRIDRLELDLGPVRDDEIESALAARLREKLRDALRDYVLAREKTVVAGAAPAQRSPADLEKLAYFLRYGHLTWNTNRGQSGSVVELLEEALLESPNQIVRLFEGAADFDTVVFRLASQFPEAAVRDLVARLAVADPSLAAKVAAALKIQSGEFSATPGAASGERAIVRAYELHDQLRRMLIDGPARDAAFLGPLLEELQRKYPWQLLRLYRELQAGEGRLIRITPFYGVEDLQRLVDAFLSVVEDTTQSIDDFRRSIEFFAERSVDRKAYYAQVLHRLVRDEVLDLEEFSKNGTPAEAGGDAAREDQGEDEDLQALLAGRPERAREWFRRIASDPVNLPAAIESLPERALLRLLYLLRASSAEGLVQAADAIVESAYAAGMNLPYAKVSLVKWESILLVAAAEEQPFGRERFIKELGQRLSGDVPQESRQRFMTQLHESAPPASVRPPLKWDVLIRAYDLYDFVLLQLEDYPRGAKAQALESWTLRTALQELLERYPLHVRRLFRALRADPGLLIHIQQRLPLEDLQSVLQVFLADLYPGRGQGVWEGIARRAALSADPGRYYGQVLQRLLSAPGAGVDAQVAGTPTEESDEQLFERMASLLEDRDGAIRSERALLELFSRAVSGGPALLIRTADEVADTHPSTGAGLSAAESLRLKWAFLFRYAAKRGADSDPARFEKAFARHLEEHLLSVPERVRRIQRTLWDRSRTLDESLLINTLRALEIPAAERLLLAAESVAHRFYHAGLALPQSEIARLKWQMVFSDTLIEEPDRHAAELATDLEALLTGRLPDAGPRDLQVVERGAPQHLDWSGWIRAYELYELLRRALIDGNTDSVSGLMAALDETLRQHPWQLLRLHREMQAGEGISIRLKDSYGAEELKRLVEAVLAVSVEHAGASRAILAAITALEPREGMDGGLQAYYYGVLAELVRTGRPPASATELGLESLPKKIRWIQARLKDRADRVPEGFLVHVLREMDSPAVRHLLQTAETLTAAYYRARPALFHGEMARLKWEMLFSEALLEAPETHAAELAERFRILVAGRPGAEMEPAGSPIPGEFDWTSWARAYELYDRLRRVLVDGAPDGASGLMPVLEETVRFHPWQLLRLYREMQAGDGLSPRFRDLYEVDGLKRVVGALLSVSKDHPAAAIDAIVAFEPEAADLRLYYADVLEQLVQEQRPPGSALEFVSAPLPEKLRRVQGMLRDRSRSFPELLLVQVLREASSPAIDGLLRTADSVADAYYRAAVVLPKREIARLKWELIFSDTLLEEPELHAAEFEEHFRFLLTARVDSGPDISVAASRFPSSGWDAWIRSYELYDRLRRVLVEGKPDGAPGLVAVLEETLRLYPWQLRRLYREMQAGDGLAVRVEILYGADELRQIAEAFLTVSEEEAGSLDGLKKAMAGFAMESKDRRRYYAALLQQLLSATEIDLELALTHSGEERPKSPLLEPSGEWRELARSYELYEELRRVLLSTDAGRVPVADLVEELEQSYPWQIRKLYRELESLELQAAILKSRDAAALRSLIAAFAGAVRLAPTLAAMAEQELLNGAPADAVQRYRRVLERLIRTRVEESGAPVSPPSVQADDAREWIRVAEGVLRSGEDALRKWIEEKFASGAAAERLVRSLPDAVIARMLIAGAPTSSPALLLMLAERLAMAASLPAAGLSPRRTRELKWMFVLRHGVVEKRPFVESQVLKSFAALIHSETRSPSVEALRTTLAEGLAVDGMSRLVRQEVDKTYGAIELERGIPVLNAGMVLAAPYLPKLFAELNLTEGRKFRSNELRERAVHLLQFMVTGSEETAEHELVLNKILCGMDTSAPVQRGIDLMDREKRMIESLLQGMILNWKKIGQTSVAGFRESFLQREGTLRLTDDAWNLEVFPRAFDVLLDYIPWTFETIKYPWMVQLVYVKWR